MPAETAYPPTAQLPLAWVLSNYRPGSQDWSWAEEFADIIELHPGRVAALVRSMAVSGFRPPADDEEPVLLGEDKRLWSGHHRLLAALLTDSDPHAVLIPPGSTTPVTPPRPPRRLPEIRTDLPAGRLYLAGHMHTDTDARLAALTALPALMVAVTAEEAFRIAGELSMAKVWLRDDLSVVVECPADHPHAQPYLRAGDVDVITGIVRPCPGENHA